MYLLSMKRWDEAVAMLRKASAAEPKSSQYRYNLAKAMVYSGDLRGAMPHFAITVGEAAGYYNIGYILQEQGQLEAAERQYRMALSVNPKLQEARQMLSEIRRGPEQETAFATRRNSSPYGDSARIRPDVVSGIGSSQRAFPCRKFRS